MFQRAVRSRQLGACPVFPDRLEENGQRHGFFEHAEYTAVRQYLPAPYRNVLDFAYYWGWRKREILDLSVASCRTLCASGKPWLLKAGASLRLPTWRTCARVFSPLRPEISRRRQLKTAAQVV